MQIFNLITTKKSFHDFHLRLDDVLRYFLLDLCEARLSMADLLIFRRLHQHTERFLRIFALRRRRRKIHFGLAQLLRALLERFDDEVVVVAEILLQLHLQVVNDGVHVAQLQQLVPMDF